LIVEGGPGEPAISPDSPADQAGLEQGDLVLELNGERISLENSLAKIIAKYNPGDEVVLKVLKGGEEKDIKIILIERPD
jgi:putative serine protease PepD